MHYSILRHTATVQLGDQAPVEVRGKCGQVLRLLLLGRGRSLSKADLALEFGGIKPSSVESVISRLRATIRDRDKTVVVAAQVDGGAGYRLELADGTVDAFELQAAVAASGASGFGSFEDAPDDFGSMLDELRKAWERWHTNPAPDTSVFDFAEQQYWEFARSYEQLGRAVAYSYLRRWLRARQNGDLTNAIAFLNRLVVGDQTPDEVWSLLLRAEGSQPGWSHRLPALVARIEDACGSVDPELRELIERIENRDEKALLLPSGVELVQTVGAGLAPSVEMTESDRSTLVDLAQMIGISSFSALQLRGSQVDPKQCIEKTVQRLWFAGIFAQKWVLDPAARLMLEGLLDRLDGDDDSSVHFLLLDPDSESFRRFRAITQVSEDPESISVLRELSQRHRSLKVRLYDSLPSFRIVIIDDSLVSVAPYLNVPPEWLKDKGWESPHLVLAPMAPYPLAKSFEVMFRETWRRAQKLEATG